LKFQYILKKKWVFDNNTNSNYFAVKSIFSFVSYNFRALMIM
jgi:hypothetical protein